MAWGALFVLVIAYPWLYFGMYAGDGVIHLVFAENAARGNWYEFNAGEKSAGETSTGYFLLVSGLYAVAAPEWVPLLVKLLNLAAWYGLCWSFYRLAQKLLPERMARLVAAAGGLIPGSAYNATIGMEAGLFGLLVMLWLHLLNRQREHPADGSEGLAGLLLGCATWIRPEAGILALAWGSWMTWERRHQGWQLLPSLGRFGMWFLVPCSALVAFHYYHTGALIPVSALSRAEAGNYLVQWGPFHLSFRLLLRLAAYAPLTLAAILGFLRVYKDREGPPLLRLSAWSVAWLCVAFSIFLPDVHLARYSVFWMPLLLLLAGWGIGSWRPARPARYRSLAIVAGVVFLLAVWGWETDRRLQLGSRTTLWDLMDAPRTRSTATTRLLAGLEEDEVQGVRLALVEVQIRYGLDERVRVYSLDGRTDGTTLDFFRAGKLDLTAYLRFREIDYLLLDFPESLPMIPEGLNPRLRSLLPSERMEADGATFLRVGTSAFVKVTLEGRGVEDGRRR